MKRKENSIRYEGLGIIEREYEEIVSRGENNMDRICFPQK
jgi:hypothetical protein